MVLGSVTRYLTKTLSQPPNTNWVSCDLVPAQDNETTVVEVDFDIRFLNKHPTNASECEAVIEVCSSANVQPQQVTAVSTASYYLEKRTIWSRFFNLRNSSAYESTFQGIGFVRKFKRIIERGQVLRCYFRVGNDQTQVTINSIVHHAER